MVPPRRAKGGRIRPCSLICRDRSKAVALTRGALLETALPEPAARTGVAGRAPRGGATEASWRSGYAEDCKSLHPGSIPGEASISIISALEIAVRQVERFRTSPETPEHADRSARHSVAVVTQARQAP